MFCANCGELRKPAAKFCNRCGSQFPVEQFDGPAPGQGATPGKWPLDCPKLEGETLRDVFSKVEVTWEFAVDLSRYEPPPPVKYEAGVMVTSQRIIFLNASGKLLRRKVPFKERVTYEYREGRREIAPRRGTVALFVGPFDLSPFWVLKRSANEELHREFRNNPKGYSKAPVLAWWVHGHRDWTWVGNAGRADESPDLRFELVTVSAWSQWGPGRQAPVTFPQGTASLSLGNPGDPERLENLVSELAELGPPFAQEYIANLPRKPMSGAYLAYCILDRPRRSASPISARSAWRLGCASLDRRSHVARWLLRHGLPCSSMART